MEELGERIIKVIDGTFSESQYITIDLDEQEIIIRGILGCQTHKIKDFIRKIEIRASERGKSEVIARVYLNGLGDFTTKMQRALYRLIEDMIEAG